MDETKNSKEVGLQKSFCDAGMDYEPICTQGYIGDELFTVPDEYEYCLHYDEDCAFDKDDYATVNESSA